MLHADHMHPSLQHRFQPFPVPLTLILELKAFSLDMEQIPCLEPSRMCMLSSFGQCHRAWPHLDALPYLIPRGCETEVQRSSEASSVEVVRHLPSERGQVAGGCVAGEAGSHYGELQQGRERSLRGCPGRGPPQPLMHSGYNISVEAGAGH